MSKRGRPKKSEELRRAQGLRSHKAKPKTAPAAEPSAPAALEEPAEKPLPGEAPDWLSPAARKIWRAAAPGLIRHRLLVDVDAVAFGRYCEWLREYVSIQAGRTTAAKRKVVAETKSKHVKMQRIDRVFQALMIIDKRLLDFEDRFGMNPRERLAIMAKLAGGSHVPQPPAPALDKGEPGDGRVITPTSPASSPIGFLNSKPH